jgi:hypothetical protein
MSLQEIKVSREEVLGVVRENKEKHDNLLKVAIEGYWIDAESYLKKYEKEEVERFNKAHKQQLKQLRKNRKEFLKSLKSKVKEDLDRVKDRNRSKGFNYWRGNFPEDHGEDYKGTIRRLELCVEDHLKLDNTEFDCYILNKWTWKQSFLTSNTCYINSFATASYSLGASYWTQPTSYAVSASWSSGSCLASYCGTGSAVALSNF